MSENAKSIWQDIWHLVAALLIGGAVALIIGYAQGDREQGGYDIPKPDDFPSLNPQPVAPKIFEIELYKDFVMEQPINKDSIVSLSRILQTHGRIASGSLIVEASTTQYGTDETRRHTVYFYIDDGRTGGHLGATEEDGLIADGYFTTKTSPFTVNYPLHKVSVSMSPNGKTSVDLLSRLNDGKKHYIGAFVATGKYGSLDKLAIRYQCEPDSECTIEPVK